MALVTIITPTYNRGNLIKKLYISLEKQTSYDFKWLIVDDGSMDDTREIVEKLRKNAVFPIIYKYKKNGGKHTALNIGIKDIDTPLTIIVDSDDRLLANAIEEIAFTHKKYADDSNISAYSYLKCYSSGKVVASIDDDEIVSNYIEYRIKSNRLGDMAEVFKTEYLKRFPFPEFTGEKFLSEDIVWIEIAKHSDCVFINKAIYECEYLEDGLTANDKRVKFASPLGSMMRGKQLMSKKCGLKANIKGAIIYNCYCAKHNSDEVLKIDTTFRERVLILLFKPAGFFFRMIWRRN